MLTVGIDPGKSGACAILENGKFRAVIDLAEYYDQKGRLLVGDITEWIHNELGDNEVRDTVGNAFTSIPRVPDCVIYEQQWGRLGDGAQRAFMHGYNYCLLEWQLWACYDLKAVAVSPQKWKAAAGLIGQDKKASVRKAREELPEAEHWLKRWKDDGRAEAMLIAKYGG